MENILITKEKYLCQLTVNRPDKMNALNRQTLEEIDQAFEELIHDSSVRAVVITGAGEKAFVAGADIQEFVEMGETTARETSQFGQGVFRKIETCGKPVIAAVNGFALGGGLELALSASFRIGSQKSRYGLPEVTLGLIPGYGGTQRLAREIGGGRAAQMISSAQMIDAVTAHQWGLINEIHEPEELLSKACEIAELITSKSPVAVKKSLEALSYGLEHAGQEGFSKEADLFGQCFSTEDMKEGVAAFLEKRAAKFNGR